MLADDAAAPKRTPTRRASTSASTPTNPDPSIDDIRAIVENYPVFRVIYTS